MTFGDLTPAGVPAKFATLGLTFDDVLLLPNESDVIPSEVDTTSLVSRRIKVRIPLLSSAMDTVTEARMAIAIAREGGLGILHRNMSIEEQAAQVDRVKRSEAGMVSEPITVGPDRTIGEVDAMYNQFFQPKVKPTSPPDTYRMQWAIRDDAVIVTSSCWPLDGVQPMPVRRVAQVDRGSLRVTVHPTVDLD